MYCTVAVWDQYRSGRYFKSAGCLRFSSMPWLRSPSEFLWWLWLALYLSCCSCRVSWINLSIALSCWNGTKQIRSCAFVPRWNFYNGGGCGCCCCGCSLFVLLLPTVILDRSISQFNHANKLVLSHVLLYCSFDSGRKTKHLLILCSRSVMYGR